MHICRDEGERNYLIKVYRKTLSLVPEFDRKMDELAENAAELNRLVSIVSHNILFTYIYLQLVQQMGKTINSTRSDDTGGLHYDIIGYLVDNPAQEGLNPPIPKQRTKADQGLNHPVIAKMICP